MHEGIVAIDGLATVEEVTEKSPACRLKNEMHMMCPERSQFRSETP